MTDRNAHWANLMRRARRGDGPAYARFLAEVTPAVRKVVRARSVTATPAEVEELVQDVLLALHAKRHTWREDAPIAPWLYAIARYKSVDAARRRKIAVTSVPIDDLSEVLPDDRLGDAMADRDLQRLLSGIDERSARIVRSLGVDGDSAGEVGERLGMTDGAVRVAYHRAMTRLRKMVGTEEARSERQRRAEEE